MSLIKSLILWHFCSPCMQTPMLKILLKKYSKRSPTVTAVKVACSLSFLPSAPASSLPTFLQELLPLLGSADLSVVVVLGGDPGTVWAVRGRQRFLNRQSPEMYWTDWTVWVGSCFCSNSGILWKLFYDSIKHWFWQHGRKKLRAVLF